MDLEVSRWTRRERLERIASAERDRRAGRKDLAVATLGDGPEWSARVVLALIHLPQEEGADARSILEATLDDWAAESGLDALSGVDVMEAAVVAETPAVLPPAEEVAFLEPTEAEVNTSDVSAVADVLAEPIEFDELERAFAEAEAQTDEMHDVNTVAARVLMDEPIGFAELSGDAFEDIAAASAPSAMLEGISATDDALTATTVRPTSYDVDPTEPHEIASVADYAEDPADEVIKKGRPSGTIVIGTLERWLTNLETTKTGRAQGDF